MSTVIIGCDNIPQLEENVQIARDFTPLSNSQMAALNELAAPVAEQSSSSASPTAAKANAGLLGNDRKWSCSKGGLRRLPSPSSSLCPKGNIVL